MDHGIILAPEIIGHIFSIPVTNTLFVGWIVMALLISFSILATRRLQPVPGGVQNFVESIIDFGWTTVADLAHSKAKVIFPICMTFFLYILVANWIGLLPGFGTVGFYETINGQREFVPLFRSLNSDLNMTLGLAIVSAVATHYFAVKYLGWKDYFAHWFSLNPILLFVGLLEIISEFTKVVSLSFRLFGNIFAGEVVLSTVSTIAAFVAPLPFYGLEIVVGFVQAAVFMMLTLVFMVLLSEKHPAENH